MGQLIKFINSRNEEIILSNIKPFLLQGIEGLSDNQTRQVTYKGIRQDGETYKYSEIEKKQLTIKFAILAETSKELMDLRDDIIRVFSPKIGEGTLIYSYEGIERKLKCVAEGSPAIKLEGGSIVCEGQVILLAHKPFWEDIYEIGEQITTWIGGWKFKFRLPFKFKTKGETKKNIFNSGHVETPIEVIFKGPAVNPSIINHTTGELIKVNRTLTSDDTLIITTAFGNKKVEIERNGVRTNAFNYIDLDSTFFSLEVGDNLIEYTTESLEPQSVEIRYRNRYLGV